MSSRKIHTDKQGIYILLDRRKFRPTTSSQLKAGDKTYAFFPDRDDKNHAKVYTNKQVQSPTDRYPRWVRDVEETWKSTDVDPRIREGLSKGQQNLSIRTGRGQMVTVIVGADGYDFREYRRDPTGNKYGPSKLSTRGVNLHLAATRGAQFTWEEWDLLCAEIAKFRDIVPVAPIVAKLEQELQVEEELQAYIQEKGLA